MTNNELLKASLLDILFDGRNKEYGAYALRRDYGLHMKWALGIASVLVLLLVMVNARRDKGNTMQKGGIIQHDSVVVLTEVNELPYPPVAPSRPRPLVAPAAPAATVDFREFRPVPDELADTKPVATQEEIGDKQVSDVTSDGKLYDGTVSDRPAATSGNETMPMTENKPAPFIPDQRSPEFPGGSEALLKFLSRNLQTPSDLEPGEKKMVKARFRVDADGSVTLVEIELSGGHIFDKEVIRVCKKMPKWKPAVQNGQPVSVSYVLPVTFIGAEQ